MNLQEIREIAKLLGVTPGKLKKADLIHKIQDREGNFPCFGTAEQGFCDQEDCCWRNDCLPEK